MPRSRREGMPCHPLFLCVYQYQSCHRSLINIYINLCGLENNISILEKTERESREAGIYEKRQRGCCLCLHHPIYQPKPLSCYFQPTHSTIINLRTTYQHPCLYIYLLSLFFFPLNTLFFYFTIFSVLVRFRSNLVNTSPTSRGWPQVS